jgi:hypothetical protein
MVGAYAFLWAWREFADGKTWRRVRERFDTLRNGDLELPRRVRTETEWLAQFDPGRKRNARKGRKSSTPIMTAAERVARAGNHFD